jgi:hypothetical protein
MNLSYAVNTEKDKKSLLKKQKSSSNSLLSLSERLLNLNPIILLNKPQSLASSLASSPTASHLSSLLKLNNSDVTNSNSSIQLAKNDQVNIDLDFELVQSLQVNHGGWCEKMFEIIGNTGTVIGFDDDLDVKVFYPKSRNVWTLNPNILTKVTENINQKEVMTSDEHLDQSSIDPYLIKPFSKLNKNGLNLQQQFLNEVNSSNKSTLVETTFSVDDLVEISSDLERVKLLQRSHGGITQEMIMVCIGFRLLLKCLSPNACLQKTG